MTASIRTLTYQMLREEWRFHERIVGSRLFVLFPFVFTLLAGGLLYGGHQYGLTTSTLFLVTHLLIFAIGLHMGNVALTGKNAITDLLSGVRFLVYTSRTMPLSTNRLMSVFLLQHALYYTALLTLPLAVGFAPIVAPTTLPYLVLSFTGMYVSGLVISLLGVVVMAYGAIAKLLATLIATSATALWVVLGVDVTAATPYGIATTQTPLAIVVGSLPVGLMAAVAVLLFTPTFDGQLRSVTDRYTEFADMIPWRGNEVAAKTLLAVGRGDGGVLKLVGSATLIFGLCVYLFTLLDTQVADETYLGVPLGALFGLEAILIYTWLVRFDSVTDYTSLPVTAATLVWGKTLAFLTLAIPLAGLHYLLAVFVIGLDGADILLGAVVLLALLVFFFSVALAVARFAPHEHLFHPLKFLIVAVAVFTPLLGYFVIGVTIPTLALPLPTVIIASALIWFGLGIAMLRYAIVAWEMSPD